MGQIDGFAPDCTDRFLGRNRIFHVIPPLTAAEMRCTRFPIEI
jgi:hypothetical protein